MLEVTVFQAIFEIACGNCPNVSDDIPHSDRLHCSFFVKEPCKTYAKREYCRADEL